ncbi:hypothetical protein DIPPA_34933 [Diplonema papillatum]|nr:hypothetical protein DIPPA_34933 [Diplonema papillatum]
MVRTATIILCTLFAVLSNAAWDRGKMCDGCKWLHAKLRNDYELLNPKVRRYGGGFTSYSRAERAAKAVDGWCDDIPALIYTRAPPVGEDGVPEIGVKDIKMLESYCRSLQEKYRLKAVSLLSAVARPQDLPLTLLCQDECGVRKKKPKNPAPAAPPREKEIPSDETVRKSSVKELKRFLKLQGKDPRVIGVTKSDLIEAVLAETKKLHKAASRSDAVETQDNEGENRTVDVPSTAAGCSSSSRDDTLCEQSEAENTTDGGEDAAEDEDEFS